MHRDLDAATARREINRAKLCKLQRAGNARTHVNHQTKISGERERYPTLPVLQDLAPVWHASLAVAGDVVHITAIRGPGPRFHQARRMK
jgi:hypothetical protein